MSIIIDPSQSASQPSPEDLLFLEEPDDFIKWINSDKGNPNALGNDGITPLVVLAIEHRHTMGVALLLEFGAELIEHIPMLKSRELEGLVLLLLVQIGHVDMFSQLLKNGINPNLSLKLGPIPVPNFVLKRVDNKVLETPILHLIAESPDAIFIQELLEHGAAIDAPDSEGNTALHVTATKPMISENGSFPNVETLLAKGADKTIKNRQGYTPAEYLDVFFSAVSPQALEHPSIQKLKKMLTPEGGSSSIILLS